jgi:hypothetical protein
MFVGGRSFVDEFSCQLQHRQSIDTVVAMICVDELSSHRERRLLFLVSRDERVRTTINAPVSTRRILMI